MDRVLRLLYKPEGRAVMDIQLIHMIPTAHHRCEMMRLLVDRAAISIEIKNSKLFVMCMLLSRVLKDNQKERLR